MYLDNLHVRVFYELVQLIEHCSYPGLDKALLVQLQKLLIKLRWSLLLIMKLFFLKRLKQESAIAFFSLTNCLFFFLFQVRVWDTDTAKCMKELEVATK